MRIKKSYLIIGLLVVVAAAFVFSVFNNSNSETEDVPLQAYFSASGNFIVAYQKTFSTQLTVLPEQKKITVLLNDSIVFVQTNPAKNLSFTLNTKGLDLGNYRLRVLATASEGTSTEDERILTLVSDIVPANWTLRIVNTFPHNDSSFTQGLAFSEGRLFEGTGDPKNIGATFIGEVELKTGKILRRRTKAMPVFGEGVTALNGELFQITWKNDSCFVYDETTLTPIRTHNYAGEGWGLTHNGSQLIMSDGTARIVFRDPKTFAEIKSIQVFTHQGSLPYLNELEYIDGLLYANVWMSNMVAVIDPNNGRVIATIDATELVKKGKGNGEVLNGIAYNPKSRKIYLTGKYWPSIFEVQISKN